MIKQSFGIFIVLFFSANLLAQGVTLRDLNPEDERKLKTEFPSLFQNSASLATLDEALRSLMATGNYENIFIEENRPNFVIIGKPLRLVEEIVFEGTSEVSQSKLKSLLDFQVGERFDRKKAVSSAEKIKNFYGEQGFFDASIEVSFLKTESKNIRVLFRIKENPPCLISGVEFVTENRDLRERLLSRFSYIDGRELTTERIQKLMVEINEYLISNRYLAAELVGPQAEYNGPKTRAKITFEVREPFRWEFYFKGHVHESQADIYRALDLLNIERKNVDPANEGSERLRKHYLSIGFPNVKIETYVVNPPNTFLKRVYYTITENAKTRIKKIDVQGRISRPSKYYEDFILANSSDLVEEGFYNRSDLDNGFKNLVTDLRNQGFLKSRVLSSRIEYNEERDQVTVNLLIEEGPQTQVRGLDFEGNKFFSNFELAQITELQTNAPLRLNDFEAAIERLKTFYRQSGFLEMKLLNEGQDIIQYNDKGTQGQILFKIYEGPRIRINSIVVEGNSFTKNRVILRQADFQIGEVLTPERLEDATARLNKLGLFSRVDIRTLEEGTNVAERTLVISITERDPGVLRFGGGVNNERNLTVRGFAGVSYNNLGGSGRAVSGVVELQSNVAQINYLEHQVSAGYLEPFLLSTRTRGRVNLTRAERVFEYTRSRDITKITTSNRVDFFLERDLSIHTKLNWRAWSLESRREFERYGRCISGTTVDPNSKCQPTVQQIATLGPTLDIDYRDNPFLPTKGTFTRFIVDYSKPGFGSSDGIDFVRLDSDLRHYWRLGSSKLVWANSVRGGYLANLSKAEDSGVPTSYAFLLGGIFTVRGFDQTRETERIPKQGTGGGPDGRGFQVELGNQKLIRVDSHYYLIKSELRFAISGEHGGVIFYDGGAVLVSGFDFARPYRDSVGFGYRYNTPVGPVAIDIAFKIGPEKGEDPYRIHVSIGTF